MSNSVVIKCAVIKHLQKLFQLQTWKCLNVHAGLEEKKFFSSNKTIHYILMVMWQKIRI